MRRNKKMTLVKFGVSNFKAFSNLTELDFKNLTIIAGLNSSGKSSIYQAILLLAQSVREFTEDGYNVLPILKLNGEFVNLGVPEDVLNNSKNKTITFYLKWSDGTSVKYSYTLNKISKNLNENVFILSEYEFKKIDNDKLHSMLHLSKKRLKWKIRATNMLSFGDHSIGQELVDQRNQNKKDGKKIISFNKTVRFSDVSNVIFVLGVLNFFSVNLEDLHKCVMPKHKKHIDFENIIEILRNNKQINQLSFNTDLSDLMQYRLDQINVAYIEPFRGYPQRVYSNDVNPNPLSDFSKNSNKQIKFKYDDINNKSIQDSVKVALNYWVVDHFNLADQVNVKDLIPGLVSEITLTVGKKSIPINNVGFGTSQIIPIIYKILTSESEIIIVDEPEIHLHASVQSKLATFFYEMMIIGKTLIIETHSEYLIDKLIYHNIKKITAKTARLFWIKKVDNECVIEKIEHDDLGYILNAPVGFLCEKMDLVNEINEIRMSKMK